MKATGVCVIAVGFWLCGCSASDGKQASRWILTKDSEALVADATVRSEIFQALDAAENAGTDPGISHFKVRAATVVEKGGAGHVVLGGNTEYRIPEALHGETSLLNHVTALYGAETTREAVRFVAFYTQTCGTNGSCGDCRDYQIAATDYEHLLVACGQVSDHSVRVRRFMDQVVCERDFPEVAASKIPLSESELARLAKSAEEARRGGVTLFSAERHTGAAGISFSGKIYRAAGADDGAFHYRYPIGGLLQQAQTERDYYMRAIVVAGEPGKWPAVNYRDRQYGFEASTFNQLAGKPPILVILTDGAGKYRMTTFEAALPFPFSTAVFMPDAITQFLKSHDAVK